MSRERELEERVQYLEKTLEETLRRSLGPTGGAPERIARKKLLRQISQTLERKQKEWKAQDRSDFDKSDFDKSDFNKADLDESGPVKTMVQEMLDTLNLALVDARKHDRGISAAGTRVRKAMQVIKGTAQEVRQQVFADRVLHKSNKLRNVFE